MTDQELEAIYKENRVIDHITALRMVYNHGHYDGAGVQITVNSPDRSRSATKPTVILKAKGRID